MPFPFFNRLISLSAKKTKPQIETPRTFLCLPEIKNTNAFLHYYKKNKAYLEPWEVEKNANFYTKNHFQAMTKHVHYLFHQGEAVRLIIMNKDKTKVIGICNFTSVIRGIAQSCYLGYAIDEDFQGQGYMKEAAAAAINYMFEQWRIHRIMAHYMPHNKKSAILLKSLGFVEEGYAKACFKVAGKWQDHVLTAKIAETHLYDN